MMERWSFEKYQSPALATGLISVDVANNLVSFSPENCEILDFEAAGISADELATILGSLQRHNSRFWQEIKMGGSAPWLYSLVKQLDDLGLIDEHFIGLSVEENFIREVEEIVQDTVGFLKKKIGTRAPMYGRQLRTINSLLMRTGIYAPHPVSLWGEVVDHNFAIQAIAFQIDYASQNFPEILPVWLRILTLIMQWLSGEKNVEPVMDLTPGVFNTTDLKNIETYALSFAQLVVLSGLRVGNRLTTQADLVPDAPVSGLAVAVTGQRILSAASKKLGTPNYLTSVFEHQTEDISPLIQGIYIEQFHVTTRFVEIIGPLLAKRFKPAIRTRFFNYFHEEFGHEEYELDTCKALGLERNHVESAIPLPMTTVYVDAYTVLAQTSPLSFMLSIMITEGLLNHKNPFHDRLDQLIHKALKADAISSLHHKLNDELNHSSLSRLFLADVDYVSPTQQRQMLNAALFMLELNFRSLEESAFFYGAQSQIDFCNLRNWDRLNAH